MWDEWTPSNDGAGLLMRGVSRSDIAGNLLFAQGMGGRMLLGRGGRGGGGKSRGIGDVERRDLLENRAPISFSLLCAHQ